MRYLITFSYDGTNFNGYQKQDGLRTVQEEIENTLKYINGGRNTPITSSGRTDKGVHALNQKAHFDLEIKIVNKKTYHTTVSLELPVEDVITKGTTNLEITDLENIVFKII